MYLILLPLLLLSLQSSQKFVYAQISSTARQQPAYANNTVQLEVVLGGSSRKLTTYLMQNHLTASPPDGTVHVHYEMELVHVIALDELRQTMTTLVYVDECWTDPSLQWDPEAFGGITKTWLPIKQIWLPDVIVFNMISASRLYHDDVLTNIRAAAVIHSNGTVEVSIPIIYTVACQINVQNFPFDDQKCTMQVASWSYGNDKIRLHTSLKHSLDHYSQNEEWALLDVTVDERNYDHEGINVSELQYNIFVRRRPLFYMMTLTLPSYVMCVIAVIGLFARFSSTSERQERFTLGVTAILTMAVLLLIVSEKVPHSSTTVPLLVGYFLFNMMTVSLAAMTTGLIMRVHRRSRHHGSPPEILRKIFLCKFDKTNLVCKMDASDGTEEKKDLNSLSLQKRSYYEWILLSERLEWTFLIVFIVVVTAPFLVFLLLWRQTF